MKDVVRFKVDDTAFILRGYPDNSKEQTVPIDACASLVRSSSEHPIDRVQVSYRDGTSATWIVDSMCVDNRDLDSDRKEIDA